MSSVYQKNGQPLSEHALYVAKLKHGVFNNPNTQNVGVASNASDTAALLAVSSDLTIKPYERTVAAEAHTAALHAKAQSQKPQVRAGRPASQAQGAARNATDAAAHDVENIDEWNADMGSESALGVARGSSQSAANHALQQPHNSYAKSALDSLYSFDDVRTGTSTMSSTTRKTVPLGPVTFGREGIQSQLGSYGFNIATLNQAAQSSASRTMTSRINPELDARSGLQSAGASSAFDIGKVHSTASTNSAQSLNARTTPVKNYRSGVAAAAAPVASAAETASSYINPNFLRVAQDRASAQIRSIERDNSINNPAAFTKEDYMKALAVATEKHKQRATTVGKVDVGGGLLIDQAQVDALARKLVTPVLADIDTKAGAQRKLDADNVRLKAELKAATQQAKRNKEEAKRAEKLRLAEEKFARKQENKRLKEGEVQKQTELQRAKQQEISETGDLLTSTQAEADGEKAELLAAKAAEEERIAGEETVLQKGRADELAELQAAKDVELQPLLDDLAAETEEVTALTTEKETLATEVAGLQTKSDAADAQLRELELKLAETEKLIASVTQEHATAETQDTEFAAELATYKETSARELEELAATHSDGVEKHAALETEHAALVDAHARAKDDIRAHLATKVVDEQKINAALPQHLQKELDVAKLQDASTYLLDEEPEVEEPKVPEATTKEAAKDASAASSKPSSATTRPSTATSGKTEKSGFRKRLSVVASKFVSLSAKPVVKTARVAAPATKIEAKTEATEATPVTTALPVEAAEVKRTFSGFSQGSVEEAKVEEAKVEAEAKPAQKQSVFLEDF
ncbi:hypothetical protein BABINDRAFT_168108 [Babjeviella inositovora NRRL Y-12698]|uniref:Eisosome protein 1 n=1 Tax=Babjeviella inositovora NRRL Y-12698 TaxID=984486 RepID=A0A1E3QKY9_9ASCO|nr:uncharacterized protein BABINDRAFT_168108 [Babjeviella inositovora NRRL Y-12698]ODQ78353.1 hypothetical protein BABINDRAFT_168108 [Babjeviella inositovora NRRL Y-12698]